MSDIEEPTAKMSKLEEMGEGDEMDNGQEEWLSEDILTDDDYNPAADHDESDANTSQEEGMDQGSQDMPNSRENIERTLNKLENAASSSQEELPKELGAFLVRKPDQRVVEQPRSQPESELDESTKQSEDDGNDTDDLLRMLGEDGNKSKDASASQNVPQKATTHTSDEDDDEYIFEGATVKKLKVSKELLNRENKVKKLVVSKGAFIQKSTPSRAVPEDTSDKEADNHVSSKVSGIPKTKMVKLDSKDVRNRKLASKAVPEAISDQDEDSLQSSDEASTMKRMFDVRRKGTPAALPGRRRGINAVKTVTKRVISIDSKGPTPSIPVAPPVKYLTSLPAQPPVVRRAKLPAPRPAAAPARVVRSQDRSRERSHVKMEEEEHLEEFNELDSLEAEVKTEGGLRLMRPERMDEEVPSDADSHSEEDSYYDDMPSSESEDADDWFTLDIRGERAVDYIPMLGEDAKSLLLAEQARASARLGALRRSAGALVAGRRSLAAQLRGARSTLAQLDAALAQ